MANVVYVIVVKCNITFQVIYQTRGRVFHLISKVGAAWFFFFFFLLALQCLEIK